jgi:hypothetical protein
VRGQLTQRGALVFLECVLTPDLASPPEGFYIAVTTRIPRDSDTGNSITEPPSETGYGRAFYPTGSDYWRTAGYGNFWNAEEAVFPVANAQWTELSGWGLLSSIEGGDLLALGRAEISAVPQGEQLVLSPGQLVITMRGASL